jgi:hypothetical protein
MVQRSLITGTRGEDEAITAKEVRELVERCDPFSTILGRLFVCVDSMHLFTSLR